MKIYCDTSSLFSNANRDKKDAKSQQETTAIARLLGLHRQGKIQLVQSNVVWEFLDLVPVANDEKVLGFDEQVTDPFGGFASSPLVSDIQDEPLFEKLKKQFGLKKFDAQHLAQALSNGADILLTRDEKHFLKPKRLSGHRERLPHQDSSAIRG